MFNILSSLKKYLLLYITELSIINDMLLLFAIFRVFIDSFKTYTDYRTPAFYR